MSTSAVLPLTRQKRAFSSTSGTEAEIIHHRSTLAVQHLADKFYEAYRDGSISGDSRKTYLVLYDEAVRLNEEYYQSILQFKTYNLYKRLRFRGTLKEYQRRAEHAQDALREHYKWSDKAWVMASLLASMEEDPHLKVKNWLVGVEVDDKLDYKEEGRMVGESSSLSDDRGSGTDLSGSTLR